MSSDPSNSDEVIGDTARQALGALRGYAYQLYASAIAWLELRGAEELYLEVAEDYAIATKEALSAVQVKDAPASGAVTLGAQSVCRFIDSFVELTLANPSRIVSCRYLSTAPIGVERGLALRATAQGSLIYWRRAATSAPLAPLRTAFEGANLSDETRTFIAERDDSALRNELLKRIHWDCGALPLEGLRDELRRLLVTFAWDYARVPPSEASLLTAPIIEHLLVTCMTTGSRRLTRADLLDLVEKQSRVSVSRADAERMMAQEGAQFTGANRLVAENEIPLPTMLASRDAFTRGLAATIAENGVALIVGSSGMGKTVAARLAARSLGQKWGILDLRDLDADAVAARIRETLGELGTSGIEGLLIDDANQLDSPAVTRAFAQLLYGLQRRDMLACITLYNRPSGRALSEVGISSAAVLDVPSLTLDEVADMVGQARGDPGTWATSIHRRCFEGHPQLVQATITGLSGRGWTQADLEQLNPVGARSPDIEEERRATRRRLVESMPEAARTLAYRLSMALGRFNRSIALTLGSIDPSIPSCGEALDMLVGPWIELVGPGDYRVSPLLYRAGKEMLDEAAIALVHRTFADAIMSADQISPDQVSNAYVHGVAGRARDALMKIALNIVSAGSRTAGRISPYLVSLRVTKTSAPIFPDDMQVSGVLRLAQLIVCLQVGSEDEIAKVWKALWREKDEAALDGSQARFETMILVKLLISNRTCRAIPDWFDRLVRLDELLRADEKLKDLTEAIEASLAANSGNSVFGMLFMAQAGNLPTIKRLVDLFEQLDALDETVQSRLLGVFGGPAGDFGFLINNAWVNEQKEGVIDAEAAVTGFRRVSALASAWKYAALAVRAEIAVAVMQDEFGHDSDAALETLVQGEARLGHADLFRRAAAKVLYRRDDHEGALAAMDRLDPDYASSDHIERAYLGREAGICAMRLGRFNEAHAWLMKGRAAANSVPPNFMRPMAVGLGADAAYAAYRAGDLECAFGLLATAVDELEQLMPLSSLKATHCFKAIGHLILSIDNDACHVFGAVIEDLDQIPPGCCSNPEPHEGIMDLPQAPIESLWYLLADAAARFHTDVGIADKLKAKIGDNEMPMMEMQLRGGQLTAAIARQDDEAFCSALSRWVDMRLYLLDRFAEMQARSIEDPLRETVPTATAEQLASDVARDVAEASLFTYSVVRILGGPHPPIDELAAIWDGEMPPNYPGGDYLDVLRNPRGNTRTERLPFAQVLGELARGTRFAPHDLFWATIRLTAKAGTLATNKSEAALLVDRWIATEWSQIIATQRYALVTPNLTIPPIERALARPPGLARAAAIALVVAPAIGFTMPAEYRDFFAKLALETGSPG